jgi:ADP-ribosylglycohydrolase
VPEAIIAFLEGTDFEDCIRNAISLGGDSDTIGAMTGAIAEAFFGVPDDLKQECDKRLPEDLAAVMKKMH